MCKQHFSRFLEVFTILSISSVVRQGGGAALLSTPRRKMRLHLALTVCLAAPFCSAFVAVPRGGQFLSPRGQSGALSGFASTRVLGAARLTSVNRAGRFAMMSEGEGGLDAPTFVILPGFGNADVDYGETTAASGLGNIPLMDVAAHNVEID